MKLLEIRNNLVKLRYDEGENPILGRFVTLSAPDKSYVAQIINLKSDAVCSFMIAKLMFTYTKDGIVDNYDGSTPHILSNAEFLPSKELLELLPVETPLKIGNLTQENVMMSIDISVFEHNFTVFSERDFEKETFISNCARQLFWLKEKTVILDTFNIFEDYPKIKLGVDFKLPLNPKMIEFLFDYELAEVDVETKAVIQDVFSEVIQYITSLEDKFLPIDTFINVVSAQYKETQMPELALLKNKLLKYKDANVFANSKEEYTVLNEKLNERNCTLIDLKTLNDAFQNPVISYIHNILSNYDKYIYLFVPLNNENSDKKLLKKLLTNNHVFTTIFASHTYKYVSELKEHAQNILFFAPQSVRHDFANYNTFLNKLNFGEGILYGKLTQGIPFLIEINDLELDLTKDDVFGDKESFTPSEENYFSNEDVFFSKNPESEQTASIVEVEQPEPDVTEFITPAPVITSVPIQIEEPEPTIAEVITPAPVITPVPIQIEEPEPTIAEVITPAPVITPVPVQIEEPEPTIAEFITHASVVTPEPIQIEEPVGELEVEPLLVEEEQPLEFVEDIIEEQQEESPNIIEPIENIMADDTPEEEIAEPIEFIEPEQEYNDNVLTEDDLDFIENQSEEELLPPEVDLDGVIDEALSQNSNVNMVPVYPAEDELASDTTFDYKQGDTVSHPRYGAGVVEKIIKYGNKTLCSISFENVGRRLLDPSVSELEKI